MKYRHELKYEISRGDMLVLRQRLSVVMKSDSHAVNGKYLIRSLYFDNVYDKALREKIDGVNIREKFRIRYYNGDTSFIRLEKKSKVNGLCLKNSAVITEEQVRAILNGERTEVKKGDDPLICEFYGKMASEGLRPKIITDYVREPFVFAPGNVRVTFDSNIRSGMTCGDFLNPECVTVPVSNGSIILEVKWDEYLPDIIRDALQLSDCRAGAFSKYAASRTHN